MLKIKNEILKCLPDNIKDQNGEDALVAMFSVFNFKSAEDLDDRLIKITSLCEIYDYDINYKMKETWQVQFFFLLHCRSMFIVCNLRYGYV